MEMLLTLAVASAALAGATAADAADGCGRGGHRDRYGHCRPNGVIVAPALIVGGFYSNRGYWDGRRYWERRERWHGSWRYRYTKTL